MQTTYNSLNGPVKLEGTVPFHNEAFDYTLFEEVIDPANPEGPKAIAMHVPARSMSKAWQLIEHGYSERIELLTGTANLVVNPAGTEDWITMPLDPDNPTADDFEIKEGDIFCIVTNDEEAVVLSRPSKPFDISFEIGKTKSPTDALSRFILTHAGSLEEGEASQLSVDQIKQFFAFIKPRTSEAPELEVAMERALGNPEHATAVYNQYITIIDHLAHMSAEERAQVQQSLERLADSRGENHGSASHHNALDLLSKLDIVGKAELTHASSSSVDVSSSRFIAAVTDFATRTRGGHEMKLRGEMPVDGDPESDKVIWGHTQITDPEALLHFSIAHYLERYYSQVLPGLGVDFASTHKDYFLNAITDVLLTDHFGENKFSTVFEVWRQPREKGGLGWIKEDRIQAYKPLSR